jgi:hypothetical protein
MTLYLILKAVEGVVDAVTDTNILSNKPRYVTLGWQQIMVIKYSTILKTLVVLSIRWYLNAPLCSDDKELWPSGSIVSDRHSIKSGVKSCGCAKSPKLKEWQHEILVKRNIEGVGFEFKGWCGSYGKQDTKVKLFNPKTGNEWCNNSIKEIIGSKYNDPLVIKEERSVRKRIPDEIHIRDIQESGNYVKGTKFFRGDVNEDNTVSRDWYYTCPICSVDEYVTEGVCTGIFKTGLTRLKSGILACRCAKNYRPTLEQLKFKLEGLCKEDNFEFIGVVHWDGVKGSKFKWVCNKGHTNTNLAGNFIKGARCRSCGDACNGYYKDRVNEKDYLYLPTFEYNDGTNHIKCGRTFRPEKRFLELKESSGAVFVENNYLWTGSHEEVYRVEQVIKDTMYSEGYNYFNTMTERPFHGSTECYEKSEDVISLIIHIVNSSDLELC